MMDIDMSETANTVCHVTDCFFNTNSFESHLLALKSNRIKYIGAFLLLKRFNILSTSTKSLALSAAFANHDLELASLFLTLKEDYTIQVVYEAAELLDRGRNIRLLERKLKRLQVLTNSPRVRRKLDNPPKRHKLKNLKLKIAQELATKPSQGSLSGAVCKHIRRWSRQLQLSDLLYDFTLDNRTHWNNLADLVHFSPKNDFPSAPWFLYFCFEDDIPENCLTDGLTVDNVNSIVQEKSLQSSTILNDMEEIHSKIVSGGRVWLNVGILVELFVNNLSDKVSPTFSDSLLAHADMKLSSMRINNDLPVMVLSDITSSMRPVVHIATAIGGLIAAITNADWMLFNSECLEPSRCPRDFRDVIESSRRVVPDGESNPSAAVRKLCDSGRELGCIVLVTMEDDDESQRAVNFTRSYLNYMSTVCAAKLVVVSFGSANGDIRASLNDVGLKYLHLNLNKTDNPNLTSLESMFGRILLHAYGFDALVNDVKSNLQLFGLAKTFERVSSITSNIYPNSTLNNKETPIS